MKITPVLPVPNATPALAASSSKASRRTFGRDHPSRRTFGRYNGSRRTFGVNHPSRRTFGRQNG